MSLRAYNVIKQAEVIIGYKTYIDLIGDLTEGKEVISSGMTREVERCQLAIEMAAAGRYVVMISSGDPGIYGMAGITLELVEKQEMADRFDVEIVPGITSANAAAASLGAALMHDFTVISLSDLLTPWELIEKRLEAAAAGDFVTILYNPMSKKRTEQIKQAREIFLKFRSPATPVGIVRNAKRSGEDVTRTDLEHFLENPIDMFTVVLIGNSQTYHTDNFMITPRGYEV
ncbi:precorrin-3B C(17)-methyltransferase [Phosphitispora fastidiosa]|uniref:precorrin-3B C(17)-methyltransferase n=1 Tax=Phosphitispora fastidiosa TaxID=2837202 RepID=UPI001E558729|nr:precorrin-3B C(17)-methyltransferase [Phosphitispora fastidiosa]